jgi:VWFA-related protein
VLVDIVVTDSNGKAVAGLRREDFRVFENGAPQQIRTFSAPLEAVSPQLDANPSDLLPATFTNASSVGDDAPLNIIFWDLKTYESGFSNTQAEQNLAPAMLYARRQAIEFLRNKPAGSRFAIIMRTDRLKLISGFTDDSAQLALAMERDETRTVGSWPPSIHPAVPPFSTPRDDEGVLAQSRLMNRMLLGSASRRSGRSLKDLENQWMTQGEIYDLWELARWLAVLPGRKNVFWLTSSIPGNMAPILEDTGAILALARIAVYPIDWRTLTPDAIYDVTTNPDYRAKVAGQTDPRTWLPELSAQYLQDDRDRIENVKVIAEQTGGHAFFDTNDLKGALSVASEEGSHVYTLTYSPSKTKF